MLVGGRRSSIKMKLVLLFVMSLVLSDLDAAGGEAYDDSDLAGGDDAFDRDSPCDDEALGAFRNCISLNPAIQNNRNNLTRYHSSLLYLADYVREEDGVMVREKVVLKRPVMLNTLRLNNTEEEGLSSVRIEESASTDVGYADAKVDKEEGEIMRYLQEEMDYRHMPRLIDPDWNNTGWIVMGYYNGVSLQEFYQGIYLDIDNIKVQNDHKFQDRMMLKKGVIYSELREYLSGRDANEDGSKKGDADSLHFNLILSQYIAISHVYSELLSKGVLHCNPSPSSIMIKRGRLGVDPDDIIILDYSNSIRWNAETSQVFFSDIKQSCVPDLRPILAFLLSDSNVYIPLSSLDVTFFGKASLAPINIVSTIEDSTYSGQCIDYNGLLRDYYNTNFNCKDLLIDSEKSGFSFVDCNTPLPLNSALPYSFRVFHFCQKTCGICNKECENLVSIMNSDLYGDAVAGGDEDDEYGQDNGKRVANGGSNDRKNSDIDNISNNSDSAASERLILRLFKACRTNYELLSAKNVVNHFINEVWVDDLDDGDMSAEKSETLLGCRWCIRHQKILQTILIYYDLPYVMLYPNIDLFIGDIGILMDSHKTVENLLKNYVASLNADAFKNVLSGNVVLNKSNSHKNYYLLYKWKDIEYRKSIISYLLIGIDLFNGQGSTKELNLLSEYANTPTGLLYYKIAEQEFVYVNVKIIKQAFVRYMFKGFSSKYKERVVEMLRTYSLRLLANSLRNFLVYS